MSTTTMAPAGSLDRFFKLSERGSSVKQEVIAGATTFAAMAYIIAVNPAIMSQTGMDRGLAPPGASAPCFALWWM